LANASNKPLNSVGAKSAMFEKKAPKSGWNAGIVPAGKVAVRLAKIQRENKKDNKHVTNLGLGEKHVGQVGSKAQVFGHVPKNSCKKRLSVTLLEENVGGVASRAAMFSRASEPAAPEVRKGSARKFASVSATWSYSKYSPRGSATTEIEIAAKNKETFNEMIADVDVVPKVAEDKLETARPRILSFQLSVDSESPSRPTTPVAA
jgi:hypothetical protein